MKYLFFMISFCSFLIPFSFNWGNSGRANFDFDHFEVFYQILKWWHQIGDYSVTWNPYSCGGATLVGDPQMPLFHPTTLSYLFFSPPDGLKVTVLFWCVVAFISMYYFVRELGLSELSASMAGVAWATNGFFASHTGFMHHAHFAMMAFPMLLFINQRFLNTKKLFPLLFFPLALLVSIIGSPHYLWFCLPFVFLHFLFEGVRLKISLKYYLYYGLAAFTAIGLAAFYIIPAFLWQKDFPRATINEFVEPWYLFVSMLYPGKVTFFNKGGRSPHEYIAFIGPLIFVFFFLSFKLRKQIPLFITLILIASISYVISFGSFRVFNNYLFSPYDIIKALIPGFQSVQVPTRIWGTLLLPVIILSLFAFEYYSKCWSSKKKWLVILLMILPMPLYNTYSQFRLYGVKAADKSPHHYNSMPYTLTDEFYQADYKITMMELMKPNVGIKNCYQGIQIPTAKEIKTDGSSFVLEAPQGVTFTRPKWDEVKLQLPEGINLPAVIKLNQNHHTNWQAENAQVVSKFYEPLTINIEKYSPEIKVKYYDSSWRIGLIISFIFLLIWIAQILVVVMTRKKNYQET